MRLSSMGRAARSKAGLKVRQPLEEALVRLRSANEAAMLEQIAPQVKDELNVKQITPVTDEGDVLEYKVQPNLRLLGPKYGAELRSIVAALNASNPSEVHHQVRSGNPIALNGVVLEPEEVLVETLDKDGYSVSNDGGYTVAVSTDVSEALRLEGNARELVHGIQNIRRSADFDIADHIVTYYESSPALDAVIAEHSDYIRQETLSRELLNMPPTDDVYTHTLKVNDIQATISVRRVK